MKSDEGKTRAEGQRNPFHKQSVESSVEVQVLFDLADMPT